MADDRKREAVLPKRPSMEQSEFLRDPGKAFQAADHTGSVLLTLGGAPRFVLTIPDSEMNLD